jgi:hypothetical protein
MVTGLRASVDAAPRGECELHRICVECESMRDHDGDNEIRQGAI